MTDSKRIPTKIEKAHAAALKNWLSKGCQDDLLKCHKFIAAGAGCFSGHVDPSAAMQLLTKKWTPEWAAETTDLFRLYLSSGYIEYDRPMEASLCGPLHQVEVGRLPLDVAIRFGNAYASVVLIDVGALEVTDFVNRPSDGFVPKEGINRLEAFFECAEAQWAFNNGADVDFEPIRAMLTAALTAEVMRRQISLDLTSGIRNESDVSVQAPAQRRRSMGL